MELSDGLRQELLACQRNEITECRIYAKLAKLVKCSENRGVLERISREERGHYERWREVTGQDVSPDRLKIWRSIALARLLGYTFVIKLMERGEEGAQVSYGDLGEHVQCALDIAKDENEHEMALIGMLNEERLRYTGSIVLGLSDALVELTGALAGFTLALRNTQLIALTGMITGIAASLSMAASEYLSTKSEGESGTNPVKASVYTGVTYLFTVAMLIAPYLVLTNCFAALGLALTAALLIILAFNYYTSVAQDLPFTRRFCEMAGLTLGVSALTFCIGYLIQRAWGIEI